MPRAGTKWQADLSGFHTFAAGLQALGKALEKGKKEKKAKAAIESIFKGPGHGKAKAILEGMDPEEALGLLLKGKFARRQQRSFERREKTRQEGLLEREKVRAGAKENAPPKAAELRAREDARLLSKQLQAASEGPRQALGRDIERMLNGQEDPDRVLAGAAHLFGMGDFGGPSDTQTLKRVRDAAAIARQDRAKAVSAAPSSSETPAAALPSADAASSAAGAAPAANVPGGTSDAAMQWASDLKAKGLTVERAMRAATDENLADVRPAGVDPAALLEAVKAVYAGGAGQAGGQPATAASAEPTSHAGRLLQALAAGVQAAPSHGGYRGTGKSFLPAVGEKVMNTAAEGIPLIAAGPANLPVFGSMLARPILEKLMGGYSDEGQTRFEDLPRGTDPSRLDLSHVYGKIDPREFDLNPTKRPSFRSMTFRPEQMAPTHPAPDDQLQQLLQALLVASGQ